MHALDQDRRMISDNDCLDSKQDLSLSARVTAMMRLWLSAISIPMTLPLAILWCGEDRGDAGADDDDDHGDGAHDGGGDDR